MKARFEDIAFRTPPALGEPHVLYLAPAKPGAFRPSLVVAVRAAPASLDPKDLAATYLEEMKRDQPALKVLAQGPASFGETAGFLREVSFAVDQAQVYQCQFYVVAGERGYVLSYTDVASAMAAAGEAARSVFASLVTKAPGASSTISGSNSGSSNSGRPGEVSVSALRKQRQ
jgi:DcrB